MSAQNVVRRSPWRAAGLVLAGIALLGTLITWWPREQQGASPAMDPAQHAREKKEAEARARFEQGVVMLHAKQYEHAVTAFHRVLELAPRSPEAHVNMGYALLGQGKPQAARDFFNSAIELKRDQFNAYYGLALALDQSGDRPGAIGAMKTYAHLAQREDPYRAKAEALLKDWQAAAQR